MKLYNVGPDEPYDITLIEYERYEWFVYWYEYWGYDGRGQAVGLRQDGLCEILNLGHCSCYGPIDNAAITHTVTLDELLRDKDDIHDLDVRKEIKSKVAEIIVDQLTDYWRVV